MLEAQFEEYLNSDKALILIKQKMRDGQGNFSNALRKYYIFKNGRKFPRILDFERENRLQRI